MTETRTVQEILTAPRHNFGKPIRTEKLAEELRAQGIWPSYYDASGFVFAPDVDTTKLNAVVAAHDASTPSAVEIAAIERQAIRDMVVPVAQTAVGVRFDALTAAQVRALFALILWKEGAINPSNGNIRPLAQWLRD